MEVFVKPRSLSFYGQAVRPRALPDRFVVSALALSFFIIKWDSHLFGAVRRGVPPVTLCSFEMQFAKY
jgi:hypothetical protein